MSPTFDPNAPRWTADPDEPYEPTFEPPAWQRGDGSLGRLIAAWPVVAAWLHEAIVEPEQRKRLDDWRAQERDADA